MGKILFERKKGLAPFFVRVGVDSSCILAPCYLKSRLRLIPSLHAIEIALEPNLFYAEIGYFLNREDFTYARTLRREH